MNPQLHKILLQSDESFSARLEMGLDFNKQWHYHPEIEIIYIITGSGTRCIGDNVNNFESDELFLIGSNVPHMLRSDSEFDPDNPDEAIVIHFHPDLLTSFLAFPENKGVTNVLNKSSYGINVGSEVILEARKLAHAIRFVRDTQKFILLLQLLNLIAGNANNTLISHEAFGADFHKFDDSRLNKIYHYTLNNYSREITLKEIADLVNLTPHSFCRYFRSRTKKRYSLFLSEVRISQACKLLSNTELSIALVSYESGFMNFSNFNRQFKSVTGKTPLEYRKTFQHVL
ncbi:MAG: AraC family transcriptional regulator, partial [Pyrinomonadaceae bacterium]|nr:AraC family transcriptional regulator [Sphingobacteriaceae bacterium]